MTEIADRYRELADAFQDKVGRVQPEQWTNPSPCEEWDARGVVGHVIDVHGMMLGPLDRQLSPAPPVAEDPAGAFAAARADVEAVLDDPELAGTEYDGAFGRTRVDQTIDGFLGFDLVVHGWDLARATGQDDTIAPDRVEAIWGMAQGLGDNLRRPGVCGPAVVVADDAPLQDRLLGLLGRDPG
ncbi:MAG: TIGR03086 family metal-binding protein [Ilumatobacteraceae bacterium]